MISCHPSDNHPNEYINMKFNRKHVTRMCIYAPILFFFEKWHTKCKHRPASDEIYSFSINIFMPSLVAQFPFLEYFFHHSKWSTHSAEQQFRYFIPPST